MLSSVAIVTSSGINSVMGISIGLSSAVVASIGINSAIVASTGIHSLMPVVCSMVGDDTRSYDQWLYNNSQVITVT